MHRCLSPAFIFTRLSHTGLQRRSACRYGMKREENQIVVVCRTCHNSIITALRQTLSRTLLNTGKSCFRRRKTRFGVTFAAFRDVIPYVLNPKTVKVRLQD